MKPSNSILYWSKYFKSYFINCDLDLLFRNTPTLGIETACKERDRTICCQLNWFFAPITVPSHTHACLCQRQTTTTVPLYRVHFWTIKIQRYILNENSTQKVFGNFEWNLPSAPDNVPLIPVPLQRQRIRCHALDHRELRNQSLVDQDDSLSASGEDVLFAFCFGHCSLHHCRMCRQMMGLSSSESKCCTPSADEEEPPSCKENRTAAVSSRSFLFGDDD